MPFQIILLIESKPILSILVYLTCFFSVTNDGTPSTTQATNSNNVHGQEVPVESRNLIESLLNMVKDDGENGKIYPLLIQMVNKCMPHDWSMLIKSKQTLSNISKMSSFF